ncbi:hypothetical protein KCP74_14635 [Salmonella enterica subsp. enterica]|nr:hypothetical protein KCP74_14635 [Salmonella enterica subsp. enterica]
MHHVARMDDTLHVELVMPFVWNSATFEVLKSNAASVTYYGRKAIDWKLSATLRRCLKRVKNQRH